MRRIAELTGAELKWSQPSPFKMEYELRSGSELAATLKFRSSWGTFATAQCAEGSWTFKRVGFWQNRVSVREPGSEVDFARFKNKTWQRGGTLEFAHGQPFRATTNFWETNLAFETEAGEPVVSLKCGGVFRRSAVVEISARCREFPELPMLVLLGWYLAVMMHSDSTTDASAAMG